MKDKIYKRLDFFEDLKINSNLSKDGINLNIWCPFCKHPSKRKLKLSVHLEKCFYHCWLCDKKGSNIPYLVSKINKNKVEESKKIFVIRNTSNDLNIFLKDNESFEEKIEISLPSDFKFIIEDFNSSNPDVRDTIKYAINRGFSKHKLYMLRAGYSCNREFNRYLILPSYDHNGDLNFYTARNIDQDTHSGFKYKNANITKKNMIFNDLNIDWKKELTLVEGPLDLIKTNDNATCLLGSSLTEDMLLFKKIVSNKTSVKLALDADVYHKSLKIASLLHAYDVRVDILDTRGFDDVGEMTHEEFNKVYVDATTYNKQDNLLNKIRQL